MSVPTKQQLADLWAIHLGPVREAENIARAENIDQARSWVDPNGYRLSDRVWQQREEVRAAIEARIRLGISRGEDSLQVARDLEQYLNPDLIPTRLRNGRIVRGERPGVVTDMPGRGGAGSYPARRLARTETTRAHGQATIQAARRLGMYLRWRLSASHPKQDICDTYAGRETGYGDGVYPPDELPPYPPHPQCLCCLLQVVPDDDDAIVAFLRRKHGLDGGDPDPGVRLADVF